MKLHHDGFSLVELSIVLVILGLLTGGILAGQSLIRASELRSVSVDLVRTQTAVMSFRDKYMAIPGDMSTATRFWGAAHATPATCRTTSSSSTATCDGDGNGNITTMDGAPPTANISTRGNNWPMLGSSKAATPVLPVQAVFPIVSLA